MRFARAIAAGAMATGLITWGAVTPMTASAAPVASAALSGHQWEICNTDTYNSTPISPCLNAYGNGGSLVKSYAPGNTYENFELVNYSGSYWEIKDLANGDCVGDASNNSGLADAGDTDACPSGGNGGWGTVFYVMEIAGSCSYDGNVIEDVHWGNNDLYAGNANGTQFYLNTQDSACNNQFTP